MCGCTLGRQLDVITLPFQTFCHQSVSEQRSRRDSTAKSHGIASRTFLECDLLVGKKAPAGMWLVTGNLENAKDFNIFFMNGVAIRVGWLILSVVKAIPNRMVLKVLGGLQVANNCVIFIGICPSG